MNRSRIAPILAAVFVLAVLPQLMAQAPPPPAPAAPDLTGKWQAEFDTQVGVQKYTYDFVLKNGVLTGKISSGNGESDVQDGKVEDGVIKFTEMLSFMEMTIPISYTGKFASSDVINFTREVGEFATEELVAKRVK